MEGYEKHSVPEFAKNFSSWVKQVEFDRIVLHKKRPMQRPPIVELNDSTIYRPFFMVRRPLLLMRQTGIYIDQPFDSRSLFRIKSLMRGEFGNPVYEDDDVIVFAPGRGV